MYRIINRFFSGNFIINSIAVKYYDFIVGRSLHNADMVVSVSRTTARDVLEFFNKQSIVIPEGVNKLAKDSNSNAPSESILEKFNVCNKEFFLYVGNLRRQKNISFLVKSFSKAQTRKKLLIVGNYSKQKLPEKYTMHDRIHFAGYVTDDELSVLYKACTAFVFPSLFEGFGLPVLEALNNGARVISSNRGALGEFPDTVINFFDPRDENRLIYLIERIDEIPLKLDLVEEMLSHYDWQNSLAEMHLAISHALQKQSDNDD